jgi:hypothetical protein
MYGCVHKLNDQDLGLVIFCVIGSFENVVVNWQFEKKKKTEPKNPVQKG